VVLPKCGLQATPEALARFAESHHGLGLMLGKYPLLSWLFGAHPSQGAPDDASSARVAPKKTYWLI
jgi:hypothetical protein